MALVDSVSPIARQPTTVHACIGSRTRLAYSESQWRLIWVWVALISVGLSWIATGPSWGSVRSAIRLWLEAFGTMFAAHHLTSEVRTIFVQKKEKSFQKTWRLFSQRRVFSTWSMCSSSARAPNSLLRTPPCRARFSVQHLRVEGLGLGFRAYG